MRPRRRRLARLRRKGRPAPSPKAKQQASHDERHSWMSFLIKVHGLVFGLSARQIKDMQQRFQSKARK